LGLLNGGQAHLKLNGAALVVKVQLDKSIASGVVLVYRSFGIPILAPTAVELLAAQQTRTISAAEKA
jgi:hypothetical protein